MTLPDKNGGASFIDYEDYGAQNGGSGHVQTVENLQLQCESEEFVSSLLDGFEVKPKQFFHGVMDKKEILGKEESNAKAKFSKMTELKAESVSLDVMVDGVPLSRRRRQRLPRKAGKILSKWFDTHREEPYLKKRDAELLGKKTGLQVKQIRTWFTNRRKRDKKWRREIDQNSRVFTRGRNKRAREAAAVAVAPSVCKNGRRGGGGGLGGSWQKIREESTPVAEYPEYPEYPACKLDWDELDIGKTGPQFGEINFFLYSCSTPEAS
eukprot:CAMPEP_0114495986 /NCGR_PEP_ID=MMETSP0109-20121206/5525_1 /TAXON_ID=29199 /ORGANISM="Chlorarachnion reptans, Strain CCCM449" /LENGTH=265 /DNA_ID=CAMNT_0001673221 /DNA_START=262 /DNA_END=1059 /DNA_ORIENTATION=-